MAQISNVPPTLGETVATGDPKYINLLNELKTALNGNVDETNLSSTVKAILGVTDGSSVRRGKSVIATEESRSSASYDILTTPDRVSSIVMPTDGKLRVAFDALWKCSVAGAGRAAIFIGSNQLKVNQIGSTVPRVQAAAFDSSSLANQYQPLVSCPVGLAGPFADVDNSGNVTTGQAIGVVGTSAGNAFAIDLGGVIEFSGIVGGACELYVAAGTYTISVQYKSASGSVTVKERKLWVEAVGF